MGFSTLKRAMDVVGAAAGLLLLSPLMLLVALLVRMRMGSPVLFTQVRPGLGERPFKMYKFRTMTSATDRTGALLSDEQRLTSLGRFLRRTSIDELPELWNVLKGEMSLIGPRPLLLEYLERYTPAQRRRHAVRPGITGWAQVNGRQNIPFSRRIELDVWYVDHHSPALDLRILLMTIVHALRGRDVVLGQEVSDVDDLGLSRAERGPLLAGERDGGR